MLSVPKPVAAKPEVPSAKESYHRRLIKVRGPELCTVCAGGRELGMLHNTPAVWSNICADIEGTGCNGLCRGILNNTLGLGEGMIL